MLNKTLYVVEELTVVLVEIALSLEFVILSKVYPLFGFNVMVRFPVLLAVTVGKAPPALILKVRVAVAEAVKV